MKESKNQLEDYELLARDNAYSLMCNIEQIAEEYGRETAGTIWRGVEDYLEEKLDKYKSEE